MLQIGRYEVTLAKTTDHARACGCERCRHACAATKWAADAQHRAEQPACNCAECARYRATYGHNADQFKGLP